MVKKMLALLICIVITLSIASCKSQPEPDPVPDTEPEENTLTPEPDPDPDPMPWDLYSINKLTGEYNIDKEFDVNKNATLILRVHDVDFNDGNDEWDTVEINNQITLEKPLSSAYFL